MRIALACILFVTACGKGGSTDVDPTLHFADLTDLEISRLVSAASGSEGFQAEGQLFQFDDSTRADPCPAITEAGNTVTITGGCTTMDEVTIDGTAILHNPTGWGELDYDFSSSSVYEFDGFSLTTAAGVQSWDGEFTVSSSFTKLDLDLTTDSFGVAVRSDIYMECSQSSQSCEHGNSGIELVGGAASGASGGALVSGKIGVGGQTANGSMTLEGADTVKVTIANNCTSWQVVGTDRTFNPCAGQ